VNWTFRLPVSVPGVADADPVPDNEQSDPGSGCAESVKDTWLPEILPSGCRRTWRQLPEVTWAPTPFPRPWCRPESPSMSRGAHGHLRTPGRWHRTTYRSSSQEAKASSPRLRNWRPVGASSWRTYDESTWASRLLHDRLSVGGPAKAGHYDWQGSGQSRTLHL